MLWKKACSNKKGIGDPNMKEIKNALQGVGVKHSNRMGGVIEGMEDVSSDYRLTQVAEEVIRTMIAMQQIVKNLLHLMHLVLYF